MSAATITTYQWYLAIHILAAVIWVGGALAVQVFALRAQAANDPRRMADFSGDAAWIGTRIFMPASFLLVIFGFLLVNEADLDYEFWIVFPILVWIASFLVGAGFLGPQSNRLKGLIEGRDEAGAEALRNRIFLVSRIELTLLLLVVLDMALKPGAG